MRTSLLAIAMGIFLLGSATAVRAQDILDDVKRQQKVLADKFDAEIREGLADATKLAKTRPIEASKLLEGLEVRLQIDRSMMPERREEFLDVVKYRIKQYRQQAASNASGGGSFEERLARMKELNRATEEKNAEMAQTRKQAAELYRQGKFKEALDLNDKFDRKYGPSASGVGFRSGARAADALNELRGIRDERSARYVRLQTELARMMMPIEGDVEFPKDWREKTKRRTETKLTEKEKKLIEALQTPVTLQLKDQPIQAVIEEIEKKYGISIEVDKRGLDQAQLNSETPVSINARGQTLRSVLKKMLGDVGLTFTIRKEGLRVTTPELAANDMVVRSYYVGDLLQVANFANDPFTNQLQGLQSIASLLNMIQSIDPQSWEAGGGRGTITFNPGQMAIIIRQSAEMQLTLQGWLK